MMQGSLQASVANKSCKCHTGCGQVNWLWVRTAISRNKKWPERSSTQNSSSMAMYRLPSGPVTIPQGTCAALWSRLIRLHLDSSCPAHPGCLRHSCADAWLDLHCFISCGSLEFSIKPCTTACCEAQHSMRSAAVGHPQG